MIVDAHAHVFQASQIWEEGGRAHPSSIFARIAEPAAEIDWDYMRREVGTRLADPDGLRLLAEMDECAIDASVILNIDTGYGDGSAPTPLEPSIEWLSALCRRHPGRIYMAHGIDPRRENAVQLLSRSVNEWGAKGLKLWPPAGFYADADYCRPLLRRASELGIPVVIHTGFGPEPFSGKTCNPIHVDSVAVDFPDLQIVMAHVGHGVGWWEDAIAIATYKPNLTIELSMWQGVGDVSPKTFVDFLAFARDRLGPDRVLFGSDRTGMRMRTPQQQWVKMFRDLPQTASEYGYSFSQDEVDLILGGNARRIFHLAEPLR